MAMKIFNVGDVLAAADLNEYGVNTKLAVKPNDTSRNTTTTLANDPDLTVAVDANKTYMVEMRLQYTANAAANLKCAFTAPASATLNGGILATFVTTGFALGVYDSAVSLTTAQHLAGVTGFDLSAWVSGILTTAGTSGSLTLQWAQDTSNAANTTVRGGSFMYLRRVA